METKLVSSKDIMVNLKKLGVNYKNADCYDTAIWQAKKELGIKALIKVKNALYYSEDDAEIIIEWVKEKYSGKKRRGRKDKNSLKTKIVINEPKKEKSSEKTTDTSVNFKNELELLRAEIRGLKIMIETDSSMQEIKKELGEIKEIVNKKKSGIFRR